MNAGCYDSEVKDVLESCRAIDRQGKLHTLTPRDMKMTYRHNDVPSDYIFLEARLKGRIEESGIVQTRIEAINQRRETSQPIREKTGGSTFANPSVEDLQKANISLDTKVWQLVDKVGGRGLEIGGAQMSEKHCNFMINKGEATAQDLEDLGEEIKSRVFNEFGIVLRWEIRRLGEHKEK